MALLRGYKWGIKPDDQDKSANTHRRLPFPIGSPFFPTGTILEIWKPYSKFQNT
jgi:hypothetical protein